MGITTTALLLGHIKSAQVEAVLREAGYGVHTRNVNDDSVSLWVDGPDPERRVLYVFGEHVSSIDHNDVYPGAKTLCSLGAYGAGPDMMRVLAERFGGFHHPADGAEWTICPGTSPVELDPRETLLFALQNALPMRTAVQVHQALADDPEALSAVREALESYAEAAPSASMP